MNPKTRQSKTEEPQLTFDFWHDAQMHNPICKKVQMGLHGSDSNVTGRVVTAEHGRRLGSGLYAFICGAGTALNILPIGGEVAFCTSDSKALDSDWRAASIDFNDVFLTAVKSYGARDSHGRWSTSGGRGSEHASHQPGWSGKQKVRA